VISADLRYGGTLGQRDLHADRCSTHGVLSGAARATALAGKPVACHPASVRLRARITWSAVSSSRRREGEVSGVTPGIAAPPRGATRGVVGTVGLGVSRMGARRGRPSAANSARLAPRAAWIERCQGRAEGLFKRALQRRHDRGASHENDALERFTPCARISSAHTPPPSVDEGGALCDRCRVGSGRAERRGRFSSLPSACDSSTMIVSVSTRELDWASSARLLRLGDGVRRLRIGALDLHARRFSDEARLKPVDDRQIEVRPAHEMSPSCRRCAVAASWVSEQRRSKVPQPRS